MTLRLTLACKHFVFSNFSHKVNLIFNLTSFIRLVENMFSWKLITIQNSWKGRLLIFSNYEPRLRTWRTFWRRRTTRWTWPSPSWVRWCWSFANCPEEKKHPHAVKHHHTTLSGFCFPFWDGRDPGFKCRKKILVISTCVQKKVNFSSIRSRALVAFATYV